MTEYTQEDLIEELIISQLKYMYCSICEQEISGNEERMKEHFEKKHNLKK